MPRNNCEILSPHAGYFFLGLRPPSPPPPPPSRPSSMFSRLQLMLKGRYPVGFSKNQKRSFIRKARGNYKVDNGALYLKIVPRYERARRHAHARMYYDTCISWHACLGGHSAGGTFCRGDILQGGQPGCDRSVTCQRSDLYGAIQEVELLCSRYELYTAFTRRWRGTERYGTVIE